MTLNTYVPSKMTSSRHSQTWCNRFIRHLTRKKRRAYRKARFTKSDDDWKNTGLSNRKSRNNAKQPITHMSGTLLQIEDKSKKLFTFVRSRKCDSSGVAPLKRDGANHVDPATNAGKLNDQFSSVFTNEDSSPLPDLGKSPFPDAPQIQVTSNGVLKLMQRPNPHKATGPDSLHNSSGRWPTLLSLP